MSKRPTNNRKNGRKKNTVTRARLLENIVNGLRLIGFELLTMKQFKAAQDGFRTLPTRYLIRNFTHPSYVDSPGFKEAYLVDNEACYVLEAKHQDGEGSTDEKLGTVWLAFLKSPVAIWVIVFDGHFWRDNARGREVVRWTRAQATATQTGAANGAPVEVLLQEWALKHGKRLYVAANDDEWVALVKQLFGGNSE
jgi:hypothetical protein